MKYIFILVVFLLIFSIEALLGFFEIKKMKGKTLSEKERVKVYKSSILSGVVITLLCLITAIIFKFSFPKMGLWLFDFKRFDANIIASILCYAICGYLFVVALYQIIMFLKSAEYRAAIEAKMTGDTNEGVDVMVPRTSLEKKWFTLCSFTAGIGEEIVYRGFMFFLLSNIFPELNIYLILLITTIVFGALHSYQGVDGIVRTSLIGFIFGLLYVSTGSLILPIILHILVDVASNFIFEVKKESN